MNRLGLMAIALLFLTAALWLGFDPRAPALVGQPGSSLATGPEGTALARAWLAQRGDSRRGDSDALVDPIGRWLPARAVVLRLQPQHDDPQRLLTRAEDDFVRRGGRLVIGLSQSWDDLTPAPLAKPAAVVLPLIPGVSHLDPPVRRGLRGSGAAAVLLAQGVTVAVCGEDPLLVRIPMGQGDVWLLACPEIFANAHLGTADHLALLAALTDGRTVWWDERAHGLGAGANILGLLRSWGFGPLLVLAVAIGVVWWWRQQRVLGPDEITPLPTRSEAVEGVDALAALLGRTLDDRTLLAGHRERLAARLARQLGLNHAQADQRLVAAGAPVDDQPLIPALARLHQAFDRIHDEHHR